MGARDDINILEFVGSLLPGPITLDPHANTAENHFLTSPKIDAQLYDMGILDGI